MDTNLFDYELPKALIAQKSMQPVDHSRLMILDRASGRIAHHHFFEIEHFLQPGDMLVRNVSRVFRSRLIENGFELFLLCPLSSDVQERCWHALVKPRKKLHIGGQWFFGNVCVTLTKMRHDGSVEVLFPFEPQKVFELCSRIGHVPVPPYIKDEPKNFEEYQTVYGRDVGSVAAPTAGFHFTTALIDKLKKKGVTFGDITLHVGLGTFQPIRSGTIEEHVMHEEWVSVPEKLTQQIMHTKKNGRRIIAIGTTTVRALEGVAAKCGQLTPFEGFLNLFIAPGFQFQVIDGLITNFHLPKSTLLVLVSAFAGRENVLHAYDEAIKKQYRFYSFGDGMIIE